MTAEPSDSVATRGQLLKHADLKVSSGRKSLFSIRRTLPVIGWSIGLTLMQITHSLLDRSSGDTKQAGEWAFFVTLGLAWWIVARLVPGKVVIGHVVALVVVVVAGAILLPVAEDIGADGARAWYLAAWAVLVAGTAWATWRYVTDSNRDVDQIEDGHSMPRAPDGRLLPDADVPLELATLHDIRDRADFDDVAGQILGRSALPIYSFATLKAFFALMITGLVGMVTALAPVTGFDDSDWAVAAGLSGLVLFAPWVWSAVVGSRIIIDSQDEMNRVGVEARLYALRRRHTSGAPAAPASKPALWKTPAGLLFAIAWVAVILARLRSSSGPAITITLVILAVATVAVGVRVYLRSRQVRVYPLAGDGDSVLQAPARAVTLDLTGDSLQISDPTGKTAPHRIDVADVIAIEPVAGLWALAGTGVGIVTTGDPVVLAGGGVDHDPAITALRDRLT